MRRQLVQGVIIGVALIAGLGGLVFLSQQGIFEPGGKQLLNRASRAQHKGDLSGAQKTLEELIATFPNSPWTDDALLQLGQIYRDQNQLLESQKVCRMLIEQFPESPLIALAEDQLGGVNMALLLSQTVTEWDSVHEVQPAETLGKIASDHGTTVEFMKKANGLDSDLIRPGQKLKIPKGHFNLIVDKSQNRLLLTAQDQFVKAYPVSTGKDNSTPVGTFKIINKISNPVWYKQGAVVPPESPENILGTRWLGFDKKGYGIHGTTEPETLGQQVTAGCVRMANSDVEEIFAIVPVGTEVTIVD